MDAKILLFALIPLLVQNLLIFSTDAQALDNRVGEGNNNETNSSLPTTADATTVEVTNSSNATVEPTTASVTVSTPTASSSKAPVTGETFFTEQSNVTDHTTEPYPTTGTSPGNTTTPCSGSSSSFDAASFVGGIVLGLGLCVITCLIYKWYMSKRGSGAPYQQF